MLCPSILFLAPRVQYPLVPTQKLHTAVARADHLSTHTPYRAVIGDVPVYGSVREALKLQRNSNSAALPTRQHNNIIQTVFASDLRYCCHPERQV